MCSCGLRPAGQATRVPCAGRSRVGEFLRGFVRADELVFRTRDVESNRLLLRFRIVGGREWVRLGAVEMGLDCLRRHLQGRPVDERIDFEKR